MADNKDVKRGIVLYLDGKEVEKNAKSIQREMRQIQKEINGCTIGSKEYVEATRRYRELDGILQQHRAQLRGVKNEHFSLVNTINGLWQKWNVTIGAFLAAFTGVSLALSKFRKEMNAEESAQANLKALTGLDDDSIAWLQQQAEQLSTTMDQTGLRIQATAKDILEAYMLVGSAKPELLTDKEALNAVTIEALRLAEAAKMNVKDAVDGVTLALNQYGASADEASRYVNVLAAGSKFGAAGVEAQTASITKAGVAASVAKVPIESLVGSIETLAEKGIKGEVAGTGLKTFFLKLEGMADDVRPSVVGLQTALENLAAKNMDAATMQKTFGLEAYTVAQTMISSAAKVREYTEAVTGTTTAIEQAAINSDTAEAKLAQMKNEFTRQGIILVKELNPAITKFISLGMNSTRMLVGVVRFLTQYRATLILTTLAVTSYVAWINRKVIADKLAILWSDKLTVSMKSLNAVIRANPWGAAITTLTIVVGILTDLNRKMDNSIKQSKVMEGVNEKASQQFADEASHIEALNKQLHSSNLSYTTRKKALDELKEIVPGYLADLTTEGELINDNTEKIDQYLVALEKQIKLKAAQEELEQKYREKRIRERELAQKQAVEDEKRKAHSNAVLAEALTNGGSSNGYAAVGRAANSSVNGVRRTTNELNEAVKQRQKVADELEETNMDILALENEIKKSDVVGGGTGTGDGNNSGGDGGSGGSGSGSKTKVSDRIKKETAVINAEILKQQAIVKKNYSSGKINRQKYNEEMQALEMLRIKKMLQIAGLEPEKIAELQNQITDIAVKAREALEGMDVKPYKDGSYEDYADRAAKQNEKMQQQIALLRQNLALGNITREQYEKRMNEIDAEHFLENTKLWEEYYSHLRDTINQQGTKLTATQVRQAEEFQNAIAPLMEDIGTSFGKGIADAIRDGEGSLKDALKGVLKIIVDSIQKMMVAAIVQRTVDNVGKLGVWGLAKAAGEIAIVTAAGAMLDGLIDGWASGGYTGTGGAYEPAGTVHKNEFVANRFAVANPNVRSVLDVIDAAQKTGTVGNLTSSDLVGVSSPSASSGAPGSNTSNTELVAMLAACTNAMVQVRRRFEEPIVAETYATGRGGTIEAQRLIDKMTSNASRK